MKKFLAIALVLVFAFSMVACGNSSDNGGSSDATTFNVGVCQLVEHVALDAATQGFVDALTDALGDQVKIDVQNAQGESNNCATIVNNFVSAEVDLIMANATPALQAAASATDSIPVLGTSITAYDAALGVTMTDGVVPGNVSGTSDLAPLDQQAAMIKELTPNAKTVGIIYCSSEANSKYQVETITAELKKLGITATAFAFSDTNDIASVTQAAIADNDVIYLPTDNMVASNTGIIDNICRPAKVPVFCGEEGECVACGVATLTISYYDIGWQTGVMAAQILKGEADVETMPVAYAPQFTYKFNSEICDELGISVPSNYEAL